MRDLNADCLNEELWGIRCRACGRAPGIPMWMGDGTFICYNCFSWSKRILDKNVEWRMHDLSTLRTQLRNGPKA